jgi:hypothetical protein
LRVALLSLTEPVADGAEIGQPRGLLPFGPHTVVDAQLELALSLGCERIVCLAEGIRPGIIDVQRRAEGAGAHFHLIRSSRNLPSLVKSADELLVLADGLLPLSEQGAELLAEGMGVLVLPVAPALAAGFERIDLHHAWAGAMRLPGSLVEALSELPEDVDPAGALLRIALQAAIPERFLADDLLAEGRWSLVRSQQEAIARQTAWVRWQALGSDPFSPSAWLGGRLAAALGPRLMHKGFGSVALATAALVLVSIALFLGNGGHGAAGLIVFAGALAALEMGLAMQRLERRLRRGKREPLTLMRGLFDAPLALLMAFAAGPQPDWQTLLYAPLVVLGLTWLLPRLGPAPWTRLLRDRALLSIAAATLAWTSGILLAALMVYGLALLFACLFVTSVGVQLTRT